MTTTTAAAATTTRTIPHTSQPRTHTSTIQRRPTPTGGRAVAAARVTAAATALLRDEAGRTSDDDSTANTATTRPHDADASARRFLQQAAARHSAPAHATAAAATAHRIAPAHATAAAARAPPGRASRGTPDDGSDSDDESDDSVSSADSRFSTECTGCDRHVARGDAGHSCDVIGCRATRCVACMPEPGAYLCRQHGSLGTTSGGGAGASSAPATTAALVSALPYVLQAAAATGVEAALSALGAWRQDPDMQELADDVAETLAWKPDGTRTKGDGVIRRLREFLTVLPPMLTQAVVTPDIADVLLSAYVCARLRIRTARRRVPSAWIDRPAPEPASVRGEVSAIAGLLRLAALLPADPKGTLMRARRTMKKCGCLDRHAASPRGYTFLWEVALAWSTGVVPRHNLQAVVACALFVTAIHLLLRPRYARAVAPTEIRHESSTRYVLRWRWQDKARPGRLQPSAAAAGAAAPRVAVPAAAEGPQAHGIPAKHPRISAASGELLHHLQQVWRKVRGDSPGPLFCRVEPATQTHRVPPGATLVQWHHEGRDYPTFVWHHSQMSERVLKKWLVAFLTPMIGAAKASKRVLSGFRGGGEMEFVELRAPVSVRATVGWWVARRISAEGALVTYEGCSLEAMWEWSYRLGSIRIRVQAPGVFRILPLPPCRSIRLRVFHRDQRTIGTTRTVIAAPPAHTVGPTAHALVAPPGRAGGLGAATSGGQGHILPQLAAPPSTLARDGAIARTRVQRPSRAARDDEDG